MKHAAFVLLAACAAGGLSISTSALAAGTDQPCATRPGPQQLVCGSDTCVRLETLRICEVSARPAPRRQLPQIRRISVEERSHRQLEQLIASIN